MRCWKSAFSDIIEGEKSFYNFVISRELYNLILLMNVFERPSRKSIVQKEMLASDVFTSFIAAESD